MTIVESAPVGLDALLRGEMGRVVWVSGGNFSGRSELISAAADAIRGRGMEAIIVPPEIYPALSGLVSTVEEELMLHMQRGTDAAWVRRLADEWGLSELNDRDPQSLSGGQQALLVILCRFARRPHFVGLDGALEQLDPENIRRLLRAIHDPAILPEGSIVLISHNGSWPSDADLPKKLPAAAFTRPGRREAPPPLKIDGFRPSGPREPATIEVKNAAFHYPGGKAVFADLNLRLEPGRIYRLAGPNGAGKSTFARIICGILRLDSGNILVNGRSFDPYFRPGTLARLHFQNPDSQLFGEPVRGELAALTSENREPAAVFAGLLPFLDSHPFDLPFVLRKRLALTLIFHTDAPWLIFDEPSIGLDAAAQESIATCLDRLAAANYGILCISHNQHFEELISPKVLQLDQRVS